MLDSVHDRWWSVDESVSAEDLAESIDQQYRDQIQEFFSRYPSLAVLESALSSVQKYDDVPGVYVAQVPLIRAIISCIKGKRLAAKELLEASAASSRGTSFAETVSIIAKRLNIEIA